MTAPAPLRVLVCGGRDYGDREALFAALDAIHAETPIGLVIQGEAPGADRLARAWAIHRRVRAMGFVADWAAHGKAAGPIRNRRRLAEGRPDLVIAALGGNGTDDMVRQARAAGVRVREVG
jgi:hypothetical protein